MKVSNESYYEQLKTLLARVKFHGHYFSAVCPLHDDSEPSLLVYPDGFKCMGCQKYGSLAQLFQVATHGNRKVPAKYLDQIPHIDTNFNTPKNINPHEFAWLAHDTLAAFPAHFSGYLRQRRVEGQIDTACIGWWDGFYTFPAFDENDELLACTRRADPVTEKETGKRWLPCPPALYVPNWPLFLQAKRVIIVYGIFDALSLSELGVATCTSTLGKNFYPEWLEKYRAKKFLALPDKGEEKEARELIAKLGWRGERVINMDYPLGCKDPNDIHRKGYEKCLLSAVS